jgi:hypothetical protein
MSVPDAPRTTAPVPPVALAATGESDRHKQRGITVRVLAYVVVAHLLALYLYLMFAVIGTR